MKDQETGQTKKAVTNQVINYVLDDVVTAPKTGDESNVTLWMILKLAAVCAAGGLGT